MSRKKARSKARQETKEQRKFMTTYDFSHFSSVKSNFMYVHSPASKTFNAFQQEEKCIVNGYDKEKDEYDYISVVTKAKQKAGTRVRTHASFEHYGAPLIVFSNDIRDISDGKKSEDGLRQREYGLHYEVVAFEEGCNVWKIRPMPEREERPVDPVKIGMMRFPIKDDSLIGIEVCVTADKKLEVVINGEKTVIEDADLPDEFHIGVTACEGINRFYDLEIL